MLNERSQLDMSFAPFLIGLIGGSLFAMILIMLFDRVMTK